MLGGQTVVEREDHDITHRADLSIDEIFRVDIARNETTSMKPVAAKLAVSICYQAHRHTYKPPAGPLAQDILSWAYIPADPF